MSSGDHRTHALLLGATLYPPLWLGLSLLFALRARQVLGYWPTYGHPDPKELGFSLHHAFLFYSLSALPLFAFGAAMYGLSQRAAGRPVSLIWSVSPGLALVVVILLVKVGMPGLLDWFID